jgi:hypothetical protein
MAMMSLIVILDRSLALGIAQRCDANLGGNARSLTKRFNFGDGAGLRHSLASIRDGH